tara:strand:- start:3231 stop:4346 length:1116 start_codon:yes stop_codon:yes gene_type:complete
LFISQFTASNLRALDLISLTPHQHLNIILGKNNDGKTSLLEGMFFSSSLKSFKSVVSSSLIQTGEKSTKLLLNVSKNRENVIISVEKKLKGANVVKINDIRSSAKDLLLSFPVLALNFGVENIITGTSDTRRALLDWGSFHVEHSYLDLYKNFTKALKQRNSVLKRKETVDLDYWDKLYIQYGEEIHKKRSEYFKVLNDHFIQYKNKILEIIPNAYDDIKDSILSYDQGWDESMSLHESLYSLREKDLVLKHTSAGPHRCDIQFTSNGNILKDVSSMSTQVINGLLLVLSQAKAFHVKHCEKPIILIDDLFFGIDDKNLLLVINLLIDSKAQCFVTAPDLYKTKLEEFISDNKEIRIYEFKGKDLKVVNSG